MVHVKVAEVFERAFADVIQREHSEFKNCNNTDIPSIEGSCYLLNTHFIFAIFLCN